MLDSIPKRRIDCYGNMRHEIVETNPNRLRVLKLAERTQIVGPLHRCLRNAVTNLRNEAELLRDRVDADDASVYIGGTKPTTDRLILSPFPRSLLNMRRTLAQTFEQTRKIRSIGLMPFIPAGYPDLTTTEAVITAVDAAGASVIEVGLPFSDPIADGPVIQAAFTEALKHKIKLADVFAAIANVRPATSAPLVAMVSYSMVFRYGLDRFLKDAKSAGFDGLILPDLPPPEAQSVCGKVRAAGLDTILLIAPTTTEVRRKQIAELCSGFIYYLSISGVTGERSSLPDDLRTNLESLKKLTDQPVCVGFGLSTASHLQQLKGLADGAIVGSAVVRRMQSFAGGGVKAISEAVASYVRELSAN